VSTAGDALKRLLREESQHLGFAAFGVCAPDACLAELPHLVEWLSGGNQGRLRYMERNPAGRCDARSLLPSCRSVIVVAASYCTTGETYAASSETRIARYACGQDYHVVLKRKLEALGACLRVHAQGCRVKAAVDSSPVLEKAFAIAAGVGWRGRNTLVLNERLGSYFVLGLLLTDADLPGDPPALDQCGSCKRCSDACPTAVLSAPGVLDARKCISYHNTACPEFDPREADLHGWLFGCDVCQEACPFNATPAGPCLAELQPRPGLPGIALDAGLAMDERAFQRACRGTVIAERGYAAVRAAALALQADGSAAC